MSDLARQVTFKMTEELYQALRKEAYESEKNLSHVIVEALTHRLLQEVPPAQPKLFTELVKEPENFFVDPG